MKKCIICLVAALVGTIALAAMNYWAPSGSLNLTASAAVTSGDIVQVGESTLAGVAMASAPSGGVFVAYTTGIFAFENATTNAIAVGSTVYRNGTYAYQVDTTTTNGLAVGICVGTTPGGAVLVDINR